MNKLTDRQIQRFNLPFLERSRARYLLPTPGEYKLNDELWLNVSSLTYASWRFHYRYDGKERRFTFGSLHMISLEEAKEYINKFQQQLAVGLDPNPPKTYCEWNPKLCIECGEPFPTKFDKRQICSEACRQRRARRLEQEGELFKLRMDGYKILQRLLKARENSEIGINPDPKGDYQWLKRNIAELKMVRKMLRERGWK